METHARLAVGDRVKDIMTGECAVITKVYLNQDLDIITHDAVFHNGDRAHGLTGVCWVKVKNGVELMLELV